MKRLVRVAAILALLLTSVATAQKGQRQPRPIPAFDVVEKPVFGFGVGVVTNISNVYAPDSSCLRIENFEISKGYALVKRKPFVRLNPASDSTSSRPISELFVYYDSVGQTLIAVRDNPFTTGNEGDSTVVLAKITLSPGSGSLVFADSIIRAPLQSVWPSFNTLISSWDDAFADGRLFIVNAGSAPVYYAGGDTAIPLAPEPPGAMSVTPIGTGPISGRYVYAYLYIYNISATWQSNFSPLSRVVEPRGQKVMLKGMLAPNPDDSLDIGIYRSKSGRLDSLFYLGSITGNPGASMFIDSVPDASLGSTPNFPWGGANFGTGEGMVQTSLGSATSNTSFINAKTLTATIPYPLFPPGAPRVYQENSSPGYIIRPPRRFLDWVAYSVMFIDSFGNSSIGPESFMFDTIGDNSIGLVTPEDDFDSLFTVKLYDIPVPGKGIATRLLLRRHQVYGSRLWGDSAGAISFSDTNKFLPSTALTGSLGSDSGYAYVINNTFILDTLDLTSDFSVTPYTDTVSIYGLVTHDKAPGDSALPGVPYDSVVAAGPLDTGVFYQGVVTARLSADSLRQNIVDSIIPFTPAGIEKFGQRLFAFGGASDPNRLRYSMASSPLAPFQLFKWPSTYFLDFEEGDGDRFVGMVSFGNALLLLKNDKTIIFRGFRFADFTANTVFDKIGASAPKSIAKWNQEVTFAHYTGVYTISSGAGARKISAPIQDVFDSLGYDGIKKGVGAYVDGDYWLSLPATASDSLNSVTWVWNREANAWYEYSFGFQAAAEIDYGRDIFESPASRYIFAGGNDKLYEYNYSDSVRYDNRSVDSSYISLFQTKFFLEPQRGEKKIRYIDIEGAGNADSLSIVILKDYGYDTFDTVGLFVLQTDFTTSPSERLEVDAIVKNVSFVVSDFADTSSLIIKGLRIGYVPWNIEN